MFRYRLLPTLFLSILVANNALAEQRESLETLREVKYPSSGDNTEQPAYFYEAQGDQPAPLLVGLHQWSASFRNSSHVPIYAKWCIENGWHGIFPNFRGPNVQPTATGSDLVLADIVSAVEYARANANVDSTRIYLVGASGGGYTALLVAGREPALWAAVSAWVPITDLRSWHAQSKASGGRYWRHIEASCGGPPNASEQVDLQYKRRSPLTHLANARGLPIDLNAGIHDGHTGSVPISHTLLAFNVLGETTDQLSDEAINSMVQERRIPPSLQFHGSDEKYGEKQVLMRKESGTTRVTIFDGGHELIAEAALNWLSLQRKSDKPSELNDQE